MGLRKWKLLSLSMYFGGLRSMPILMRILKSYSNFICTWPFAQVTLASLTGTEPIKCSRGINIVPDSSLKDALAKQPLYDAIILPGGLPNAKALAASSDAAAALSAHEQGGKIVASICASTIALASHGICKGATVTSFPGVKDEVLKYKHHQYSEDRVCVSQKCITSRGPGTALEFGLELVKQLCGADKAEQVAKPMLVK